MPAKRKPRVQDRISERTKHRVLGEIDQEGAPDPTTPGRAPGVGTPNLDLNENDVRRRKSTPGGSPGARRG